MSETADQFAKRLLAIYSEIEQLDEQRKAIALETKALQDKLKRLTLARASGQLELDVPEPDDFDDEPAPKRRGRKRKAGLDPSAVEWTES